MLKITVVAALDYYYFLFFLALLLSLVSKWHHSTDFKNQKNLSHPQISPVLYLGGIVREVTAKMFSHSEKETYRQTDRETVLGTAYSLQS